MSSKRVRAFVGTLLGAAVAVSMMSLSPIAQADLDKPKVSANGVVRSSGYFIIGDKYGQFSRVDLSVMRKGKKVAWKSGSRLKPGKYKLVARGVSRADKFPTSLRLSAMYQYLSGSPGKSDHLKSGWTRSAPTFTYSTTNRSRVYNDPLERSYGESASRTDDPVFRYWELEESNSCGDGYWQPYYSCYWYFNDAYQRVEVPLNDSRVSNITDTAWGSAYCAQGLNQYSATCTGKVLVAADGEYWAYQARSGTETIPSQFTAKASVTYRNTVTDAEYVSSGSRTETRQPDSGQWITLAQFQQSANEFHEVTWGTATRSKAPKSVLLRDSVKFQVKPRPKPKPKPGGGNSGGGNWSYDNCTEARNAGAAPVYRGDPGYGPHLDSDNDGVGCE